MFAYNNHNPEHKVSLTVYGCMSVQTQRLKNSVIHECQFKQWCNLYFPVLH